MQNMNCICNENRCTGCGACVSICPKSAISMIENAEGFLYPVIDSSKCVDCEECFKTCPVENAFDKYDEILDKTVELVSKDKLILIALGQTASVHCYDLDKLGYQAVDIGHVDVEYEWFLMGVNDKVALSNKYVNEAQNGVITEDTLDDAVYRSQIIGVIDD